MINKIFSIGTGVEWRKDLTLEAIEVIKNSKKVFFWANFHRFHPG